MSDDLRQVAKGCHTRVLLYNMYDVNGYRFRTHKYEHERPNATTINSGLVTIGQGENSDTTEYYGYIKEIVEISFDGRKPLTLVLFNCHWFDPSKVRYTPRYGLVEVAHASILPKFEPFVLSHQATQVQPIGRLQVPNDQDYNYVPNSNVVHYFQEDGLSGSFVIDLGQELNNDPEQVAISRDTEDICNDKDLKLLNGSSIQDEDDDDEDDESYCTSSSAEDDEVPTSRDILFDEYF
uniref:Transposon protein, putative, CACTA, En/Spm sub-class n=1 Tax=Oryza sativa subsp. japonica TaxID=39947 RepID=Q2R3Z3_ORYSJ|nr:transposon protein, putative, CACTA, En/Spm sub-class [Oryza sativa Japonica Group]